MISKSQNKSLLSGFSLVELLVVISIMSVVGTMGVNFSKQAVIDARMYEAKMNVRAASTLAVSYVEESESSFTALLISNDRSSLKSCLTSNPLGFAVSNCEKINYIYRAAARYGGASNVHAFEGFGLNSDGDNETQVYSSTGCSNVWVASEGEISAKLAKDNCTGGYNLWRNNFGAKGPEGDYNGDGSVNAADYTVWRDGYAAGHFGAFP